MTDPLFHEIPEAQVILRTKGGVFKQAKVFRNRDRVFAAHGGGFIRLMRHSGTSTPSVSWLELHAADGVEIVNGLPRWSDA